MSLQAQLDKALQKEKHYLQTTITKEAYDALSRKSAACQDDLTQALEKVRPHPLVSRAVFRQGNVKVAGEAQEPISCLLTVTGAISNPCVDWDVCAEKACFLFVRLGARWRAEEEAKDQGQIWQAFLPMGDTGARFSQSLDCQGNSRPILC